MTYAESQSQESPMRSCPSAGVFSCMITLKEVGRVEQMKCCKFGKHNHCVIIIIIDLGNRLSWPVPSPTELGNSTILGPLGSRWGNHSVRGEASESNHTTGVWLSPK